MSRKLATGIRLSFRTVANAIAIGAMGYCLTTAAAMAQNAPSIPPNMIMAPHVPLSTGIRKQPDIVAEVPPRVTSPMSSSAMTNATAQPNSVANPKGLSCTPPAAPNEIVELARALKWSPDLIYEYIHNNIATIPVYDSLKGAYGTLIDGAGTPIDQAELMYVLLQQSCYAPQYEMGLINLTAAQMTKWLGTDTNPNSVGIVLGSNGFSNATVYTASGTTVTSVDIPWVWVSVPIPVGGAGYQFDPAGKIFSGSDGYNVRSAGVPSLGSTALGYTQSIFITAAETGATGIGTPAVAGIDRASVRQSLADYAGNLAGYIKSTNPAAATTDIIGGVTIAHLPPYTPPASGLTRWGYRNGLPYPNLQGIQPTPIIGLSAFRTTLTLTLGWNDSSGNFTELAAPATFNSSDIYGHRLAIEFNATTNTPNLLLDGTTMTAATGTVPAGQLLTAMTTITHPHIPGADVSNANNMRVAPPAGSFPPAGAFYVIGTGWGGSGRGMIEKHRKLVLRNQQAGLAATSEPVLGEGLAMIGYTWIAENSSIQQNLTEIAGVTTTWLHAVGIIGMKAVGAGQGPYVDLPLNELSTTQRVNRSSSTSATPAESAAFFADAGVSSILESGSIEQTQPNATAASTIKILDQWSQGGTILDMNDPEIAGDTCAEYASTLRSQLTNYGSADQARIDSLVGYSPPPGNGCSTTPSTTRVIAPSNGSIQIGKWAGTGYLQVLYNPGQTIVTGVGAIITGGLSGGEPASPVSPPEIGSNQTSGAVDPVTGAVVSPPSQQAVSNNSNQATNIAAAAGGTAAVHPNGGDPVDLVTGNYVYTHQDMIIGSGSFPFSLPFVRSFDSGSAQAGIDTSLLGNGWMHNYSVTALADSDGFDGMGANSPVDGAAAVAALYVIQDILNQQTSTDKPTDRAIIAAQAERWLMDQLTNNTVAVTQAGSIETFTLLPDGTYNPPPGSASVLTGNVAAGYTYKTGSGVTLTFNSASVAAAGKIATWTNAAGATVNFTYNGSGQLQSVANPATRRQLNLHYTASQLTSVDDNSGSTPRTVAYSYDSQNDLIGVTDPLRNTTTFGYSAPGQLAQIFYPTHPSQPFVTMNFDSLGRPRQQADANGNVSNLFFAGTRTEIDDPAGTARVGYFTARGKTAASIEGLGSPAIDNGAGNLTASAYDGLDRLLTVTFPAGNGLSYTYDAYSNPLSIARTPIPGSGLTPLTTLLTYIGPVAALPNFEEVQTVTDPRGLVTASSYDANGNRISVVADAGNGHFNATSQFTYNTLGRVLTATNPLGVATAYAYDGFGDLASVTEDYGPGCGSVHLCRRTTMTRDVFGNVVALTDPLGNVRTAGYDLGRRPVTLTLPAAPAVLVTATAYDPDGRVLQVQQSSGGQVLRTTGASYTLTGKVANATDANGNVTVYTYDGDDRLSAVTDAAGRTTAYVYDALSRPYRTLNLAIQAQPLVQYGYTPNGKPASVTDGHVPGGNVTAFAYDGFGRLSTTAWPDGSTEVLGYDADSNVLTRETRAGAPITLTYDTLNRLRSKAAPGEATVAYAYDLAGRITGISDNSATLTVPAAPAGPFATVYTYDALNRPAGATWSPAPAQTVPAVTNVTFTHTYTPANQRSGQSVSDKSWLLYPAAAGTTSYSANALNQYTAVGPVAPAYDGNGNLTFDGTFAYGYDAENRLVSIAQGGAAVASYAYDAQGRRKTKTAGGTTTVYVTDADNREVLEYDGTGGQVARWYAYGLGPDDVLNQMNLTAGTRETFIPDIQGSVLATLDSSSGALTKAAYLAYGENTSTTTGTFRFTGRRFDAETAGSAAEPSGLYYDRARMYSPTLGRFMQADPIGYRGGVNLYAYVGNDPLNKVDPLGLDCVSSGGTTSCSTSAYNLNFPTPTGWQNFTSSSTNYHFYSVPANAGSANPAALQQAVANNPTPGYPSPATPQGTLNDATPIIGGISPVNFSPVLSYTTTNQLNGNPVVLNVTLPGHQLFPGIVVREVDSTASGTMLNNYGEGTSSLQSPNTTEGKDIGPYINGIWNYETPNVPQQTSNSGK